METDWDRLDSMTDEEIDYSDIPPLGDDFFARARLVITPAKRAEYVGWTRTCEPGSRSTTETIRR